MTALIGAPLIAALASNAGGGTVPLNITAGSSNIRVTPSPLTGTGTIDIGTSLALTGNLGVGSSVPFSVAGSTGNVVTTGTIHSGQITANLTGNVTGNVSGSSGSTTGNAATVTTNANLTGPITSVGNTTSVASQTGTGSTFVMQTSPTLTAPALGTPASGVATNLTGTAAGLTAGNVTTNANLTGVITSSGNATSIASQTGTGSKFVVDTSPTLVTPILGVASATTLGVGTPTPNGSLLDVNMGSIPNISAISMEGSNNNLVGFSITNTLGGGKSWLVASESTSGGCGGCLSFFDATDIFTSWAWDIGNSYTLAGNVIGWSAQSRFVSPPNDTGLSRDNANVVDIGNGTSGDKSGTLLTAKIGLGTASPQTPLDVNGDITMETGTAGALLCLTSTHAMGHCTSTASCTSTCTCNCVAN